MTQEEFSHSATEMRSRSVAIAKSFGYALGDAEDIAQDVMLKLWCLHEDLHDGNHLRASVAISTRQMCIDKWRVAQRYADLDETLPIIDENSLYDPLEYADLERWMTEQIDQLPSTAGIVLRMRQLERNQQ